VPGLPFVSLDPRYFGMIKDFEERMQFVPSLLQAESFKVQGDISFNHPVTVIGRVSVTSESGTQTEIPASVTKLENGEIKI
jgi:UTP--glucose-1-phosphate uridylyltransferase